MSLVRFPVAPLENKAVGFNLTAFSFISGHGFKAGLRGSCKPRCKPKSVMNATVNILCLICICKNSKRKYISLGVSVAPQYWDFQKNKPKRNCPNKILIEKLIAQKSRELSELVLELEADNRQYTAATLVEKAVRPKVKATVGSLMQEHIRELRDANRTGYALSMEQVYNSLVWICTLHGTGLQFSRKVQRTS